MQKQGAQENSQQAINYSIIRAKLRRFYWQRYYRDRNREKNQLIKQIRLFMIDLKVEIWLIIIRIHQVIKLTKKIKPVITRSYNTIRLLFKLITARLTKLIQLVKPKKTNKPLLTIKKRIKNTKLTNYLKQSKQLIPKLDSITKYLSRTKKSLVKLKQTKQTRTNPITSIKHKLNNFKKELLPDLKNSREYKQLLKQYQADENQGIILPLTFSYGLKLTIVNIKRKYFKTRWHYLTAAMILVMITSSSILIYKYFTTQAATYTFNQTQWQASSTNTAIHPTNQANWTQFYSQEGIATGTELTLIRESN